MPAKRKPSDRGTWAITLAVSLAVVGVLLYWAVIKLSPGEPRAGGPPRFGNDPRFDQAIAEAKRRWPEFLDLYGRRQFGQKFFVKAKFMDGYSNDLVWVYVDLIDGIKGDVITGTVDSEPVSVGNVRVGSSVKVNKGSVVDWLWEGGTDRRGGFIERVMNQIEAERAAKSRPATTQPAATAPAAAPGGPATQPTTTTTTTAG